MENKQGCVDWLVEEINKQKAWADPSRLETIIQQAKAMYKEEMKEMYLKGIKNYDPKFGGYTGVIGVDNISWTNTNKLNNGGNNE